jgi:hypothetical protein
MYHHFQHRCSDTKTQEGSLVVGGGYLLVPVCAVCSSSLLLSCTGSYACCSVLLAVFVVFCLLFVPQGCGVKCHLEVLLLAMRSAGVHVWRQAWGLAGKGGGHSPRYMSTPRPPGAEVYLDVSGGSDCTSVFSTDKIHSLR